MADDPRLSPRHLHELTKGSRIAMSLIESRGYRTITDPKQELPEFGFAEYQQRQGLLIPIWSPDGKIVTYQLKPDTPRTSRENPTKAIKYETPKGSRMRLDVPPACLTDIGNKAAPLYITEGIKKADSGASAGLCMVGLLGVWNWRGDNGHGNSEPLDEWSKIAIKNRAVFIVFDNDVMEKPDVQKAVRELARFLKKMGARSVTPIVPSLPGNVNKLGLDDFLAQGGTAMDLPGCERPDLLAEPAIVTNNRSFADIVTDGVSALVSYNLPPRLFSRDGELVRVQEDERGIPKIKALSKPSLRLLLSEATRWIKKGKDSDTQVFPPDTVTESILSAGEWPEGIPGIIAITKAPVLARNGILSTTPGYCPDSKFFIAGRTAWPDWEGTVEDAVAYIFQDVLSDFPFASDADQTHALALMLLPILRPAIDGPTPMHLIEAPTQGSGKSLLARACLLPTCGSEIAVTPGTRDEEEWRKKITASLLEGRSYIFFDNLSRKIDSEALAGALTATEWNDRALSQSKNINVPVRCTWLATANNAELSLDILRRSIRIRIDSKTERPEMRTGFKHTNLPSYIAANSPRIVSALCFIVSNWIASGAHQASAYKGRIIGSYEEWCSVVGGVLESAGLTQFMTNVEELRESADSEHPAWCGFLLRWVEAKGHSPVKSSELLTIFDEDDELKTTLGSGNDTSRLSRLGFALKSRVGRIFETHRIERVFNSNSKTYRYVAIGANEHTPRENNEPPATISKPPVLDFESEKEDLRGDTVGSGGYNHPTHSARVRENNALPAVGETTPLPTGHPVDEVRAEGDLAQPEQEFFNGEI